MAEIISEKNKPTRVSIVGGSGENVNFELITNREPENFSGKIATVSPGEFILISETLPINRNLNIQGIFVSSTVTCEFHLEINGQDLFGGYLSTANPQTPSIDFRDGPIKALNTDTIEVKVNHNNINGGSFRASLWGYYENV